MHLVPIGRFSRMTRLSVKALRRYDESGLLVPAHVDPSSGYRYYSLGQANRAEAIRILRSVDMPLDEIRSILDVDDPEVAQRQLLAHRERLAERLAEQERRLAYLGTLIERRDGIMPYDVTITEEGPMAIASTVVHTRLASVGEDIGTGFGLLMEGMGRAGAAPAGMPLIVYHGIIDEETDGDIEICVPVAELFETIGPVTSRTLEGGTMASTVHHGPYEEISAAYHTLTGWISEHGHEIVGPARETYLNDPNVVAPDDLMTKVEFPIDASR